MYDIFPNIGRETWSGHHSTKSKKPKAAGDRSKINWPLYGLSLSGGCRFCTFSEFTWLGCPAISVANQRHYWWIRNDLTTRPTRSTTTRCGIFNRCQLSTNFMSDTFQMKYQEWYHHRRHKPFLPSSCNKNEIWVTWMKTRHPNRLDQLCLFYMISWLQRISV